MDLRDLGEPGEVEDTDVTVRPRGLVVDNDPELAEGVRNILNLGFRRFRWEVDWVMSHSALAACQLVQDEPPFDFAIVDYDLGPYENGLSVVKELRNTSTDCYILVITGETDSHPAFTDRSKRAGADHAIIRHRLNLEEPDTSNRDDDWDGFSLARRIRKHMIIQDRADGLTITFAKDTSVQSMLYSLGDPSGTHRDVMTRGEHIARTLILNCLERDDDAGAALHVEHLAPGRSGAHVCKVLRSQAGQPDETFVIKIGLDQAALDEERRANENAVRVLTPQVLIELTGGLRTDPASGYSALAARLARDAVTLASWLHDPSTTVEQAKNVADELFGAHLARLFQLNLRQRRGATGWITMSPVHQLRVHDALSTYGDVWAHPQGADRPDADELGAVLREYVDFGSLPNVDARLLDEDVIFVNAFGDLHATNVLVQKVGQPRPVLVDASRYGAHHWATDAARLVVDLVLQVRRPGVESMLWSSLADEYGFAESLCHCSSATIDEVAEHPVDAFIAQVVAKLREYLRLTDLGLREAVWHWQWHIALAREYLRQGSRPGMVPPRAVLALSSAARHLTLAAESLVVAEK